MELALHAWVAWQALKAWAEDRLADEVGEGVISTAIAVLVMAAIGAIMYGIFKAVFQDAGTKVQDHVNQIG